MFVSIASSLFLLSSLTLLLQSSSVFGFTPYTYVRVELDPDAASIKANCTDKFKSKLKDKVSDWIDNGLAVFFGQYNSQGLNFTVTYQAGWHNRRNLKKAMEANRPMLRALTDSIPARLAAADDAPSAKATTAADNTPTAVVDSNDIPQDRNLCSLFYCQTCCKSVCILLCGCQRCGGSRMLLDAAIENRDLQSSSSWSSVSNIVSSSVTILTGIWLYQNDPTDCMGNPWKVNAIVTFV